MKNVIILVAGKTRYAIELGWVREVVTLGPVTPVPGAPRHIRGVVNVRGAIMPVIDLAGFAAADAPGPARRGDGAVLIEVEGVVAAIGMDAVDEISTVGEIAPAPGASSAPGEPDPVILAGVVDDSRGRRVAVIDPPRVLDRVRQAVLQGALGAARNGASHGAA